MPTKTQATAPVRSLDQRMEALARANDIRVRRAQLKKDLKNGKVQIDEILDDPPEYVSTAKRCQRENTSTSSREFSRNSCKSP